MGHVKLQNYCMFLFMSDSYLSFAPHGAVNKVLVSCILSIWSISTHRVGREIIYIQGKLWTRDIKVHETTLITIHLN